MSATPVGSLVNRSSHYSSMIVIPVLTTAVERNGHCWQKQIMTIWMLVLVVGVVAMALGPILMLQPNPRQRRQAQLRSRALQLGLSEIGRASCREGEEGGTGAGWRDG